MSEWQRCYRRKRGESSKGAPGSDVVNDGFDEDDSPSLFQDSPWGALLPGQRAPHCYCLVVGFVVVVVVAQNDVYLETLVAVDVCDPRQIHPQSKGISVFFFVA